MTPDRQLEWLRAPWLLRAVRKRRAPNPCNQSEKMSCVVRWGDARLEITPTIHNILVYFRCQLRDMQQDDYKDNNKPTVWNAPTTQPTVFFDIKVRFTAELFRSYIEPLRRNKMDIKCILKTLKWQCYFEKPFPELFTIKCLKILHMNTEMIKIAEPPTTASKRNKC